MANYANIDSLAGEIVAGYAGEASHTAIMKQAGKMFEDLGEAKAQIRLICAMVIKASESQVLLDTVVSELWIRIASRCDDTEKGRHMLERFKEQANYDELIKPKVDRVIRLRTQLSQLIALTMKKWGLSPGSQLEDVFGILFGPKEYLHPRLPLTESSIEHLTKIVDILSAAEAYQLIEEQFKRRGLSQVNKPFSGREILTTSRAAKDVAARRYRNQLVNRNSSADSSASASSSTLGSRAASPTLDLPAQPTKKGPLYIGEGLLGRREEYVDGDSLLQPGEPDLEVQILTTKSECGCAPTWKDRAKSFTKRATGRLSRSELQQLVKRLRTYKTPPFCHTHLRAISGAVFGLRTNLSNRELTTAYHRTLRSLYSHPAVTLDRIARSNPGDFRQLIDPQMVREPGLSINRYRPEVVYGRLPIDSAKIFRRFTGSDLAWATYERDGTVNIDGVFDYLLGKDSPHRAQVLEEYDMYLHHTREPEDGSGATDRRGWLRQMNYSLFQQVMRQDPVYWALLAASRPDHNHWLVSYPYYTKYVVPSDKTNLGFAHLDINGEQLYTKDRGRSMVQGSVSVDDEQDDGATLLVPGMHLFFKDWWDGIRARGLAKTGATTNAPNLWTPADAKKFDTGLRPFPCKAGAIRISQPSLLHGSPPKGTRIRRTAFPWFTGIREDHETLDLKESETWSQLRIKHSSLHAADKSPSGNSNHMYGFVLEGLQVEHFICPTQHPICSALIAQKKWTEASVEADVRTLLGDDDEAAKQLAKRIRDALLEQFVLGWQIVRQNEMATYPGTKSYFRYREQPAGTGRVVPDGNEDVEADLQFPSSPLSHLTGLSIASETPDPEE